MPSSIVLPASAARSFINGPLSASIMSAALRSRLARSAGLTASAARTWREASATSAVAASADRWWLLPTRLPSIGERISTASLDPAEKPHFASAPEQLRPVAAGEEPRDGFSVAELEALGVHPLAEEALRQADLGVAGRPFRRACRAGAPEARRSARPRRRPWRRRRSWRRSPGAGAPDRREGRGNRRPAHRCGRRPASRRSCAWSRRAPRPCRGGAGTRSRRRHRRPSPGWSRRSGRCGWQIADRAARACRAEPSRQTR